VHERYQQYNALPVYERYQQYNALPVHERYQQYNALPVYERYQQYNALPVYERYQQYNALPVYERYQQYNVLHAMIVLTAATSHLVTSASLSSALCQGITMHHATFDTFHDHECTETWQ
jgi:hypothetical protein